MKPDPTTAEGRAEIDKILKRREAEAEAARQRSEENVDEEPTGKLTTPAETDLHRDRKGDTDE